MGVAEARRLCPNISLIPCAGWLPACLPAWLVAGPAGPGAAAAAGWVLAGPLSHLCCCAGGGWSDEGPAAGSPNALTHPPCASRSGEDLTPYRAASKAILAALRRYGPVERLGLDEFFVDATAEVGMGVARVWAGG